MVALVVLGSAIATAHHLTNRFLSGKSTDKYPQVWVTNIALAAAFLVKSLLAATIGMAFQETLWKDLRSRYTKVETMDKLLTVQTNPFSFLSLDAFKTAFGALLLAATQWSIPISAIFTPGTLNVLVTPHQTTLTCHVPTFNNSFGRTWFPGGLGVKVMNTPDLDRWSYETVVPGRIAFLPSSTFCGTNCSYSQAFVAPDMICHYIDSNSPHDIGLSDSDDWHRCDLNGTEACFLYGAPVINGEATNYTSGSFTITYSESYEKIDDYHLHMNYSRIGCRYTQAYYNLSIAYTNDIPTHDISVTPFSLPNEYNYDYQNEPKIDVDLWDLEVTARGLFQYFHTVWLPGTIQLYKYTTAGDVLKLFIKTQIIYTPLARITDFKFDPPQDLVSAIPELFRNFTISSFLLSKNFTVTTCTLNTTEPIYHYEPVALVVAYSVATVLSILCVLVGMVALRANGTPTKKIFSQLLMTTRNEKLEALLEKRDGVHDEILGDGRVRLDNVNGRSLFVLKQESVTYNSSP